ncbi:MAG: hypothetical protein Q4C91_07130 [Eubacteriales bacterium]|nr:hypothetical protein [Eubacteriales bacterium]
MTKQKRGFWLFIASLIPGAGEMYMGFRKQGISIMLIFWSVIALGAGTGMGWLLMFLPIIWFYSFFNVHNLKSLSEEEFYSLEDGYVLHLDRLLGDMDDFIGKYRVIVALLMVVFGASILLNSFVDILFWILPSALAGMLQEFTYRLPQIIIALLILILGFRILSGKKYSIEDMQSQTTEDEHYWEPYRPFQQAQEEIKPQPDAGQTAQQQPDTANPIQKDTPSQTASEAHPSWPQQPYTEKPEINLTLEPQVPVDDGQ